MSAYLIEFRRLMTCFRVCCDWLWSTFPFVLAFVNVFVGTRYGQSSPTNPCLALRRFPFGRGEG
jgi:hypothetical protein